MADRDADSELMRDTLPLRWRLLALVVLVSGLGATLFAIRFGFAAGAAALSTGLAIGICGEIYLRRMFDARLDAMRVYLKTKAPLALPLAGDEFDDLAVDIAELTRELAVQEARGASDSRHAEQILDAMSEAVAVTSHDGVIQRSNHAFRKLSARGGTLQPEGLRLVEAVRIPSLHDAHRTLLTSKTKEPIAIELELRLQGSDLSHWRADLSPMSVRGTRGGEENGVLVVLRDVTEAKRLEAMRRDFVANVSHELRTPLTSIRGFSETLLSGALDSPTYRERFVKNIFDASTRLSALVEDMLELSRAESPESVFQLEEIDVVPILETALTGLEGVAQKRMVEIRRTLPKECVLRSNRSAFESIAVNLVFNAIKFSTPGKPVDVSLTPQGDTVVLKVVDRGQGIAEEHLSRIFERFYRVDAGRARSEGGTGLGLAIVKHMAERLRATVQVKSRLGEGTTFEVVLKQRFA